MTNALSTQYAYTCFTPRVCMSSITPLACSAA